MSPGRASGTVRWERCPSIEPMRCVFEEILFFRFRVPPVLTDARSCYSPGLVTKEGLAARPRRAMRGLWAFARTARGSNSRSFAQVRSPTPSIHLLVVQNWLADDGHDGHPPGGGGGGNMKLLTRMGCMGCMGVWGAALLLCPPNGSRPSVQHSSLRV